MVAMSIVTYVMPEPQVKVFYGEFWFTGKAVLVNVKKGARVLDYLRAAGVYDPKLETYNGAVWFGHDFSIGESSLGDRMREVDEVLATIDGKRLAKDLEEKGYAFPIAKGGAGNFKDYKGKSFIANTSRVIQELVYKKIPKEFGTKRVRHFKAQESIELMNSDKDYKKVITEFDQHCLEVIQKLCPQKEPSYVMKGNKLDVAEVVAEPLMPLGMASVYSTWGSGEGRIYGVMPGPERGADTGTIAACVEINRKGLPTFRRKLKGRAVA